MSVLPPKGNLRTLSAATFTNCVGSGLWAASAAIYLTRSAGLTPSTVGLGLSVGAAVGVTTAVPLGGLADRYDPRSVRAVLQVAQAVIAVGYLFVHSITSLIVVSLLSSVAQTGNLAVRAALISAVAGSADRVHAFASLRAVASMGIGVGAALSAFALAFNTRSVYEGLVVVDACTFVISSAQLMRLPPFPPDPRPSDTRRAEALRDRPFLLVVSALSIISMHTVVLQLAVPLWIVLHTAAPAAVVSLVIVVNTILSILLAVKLSRGLEAAAPAAHQVRRSGWVIAISMVAFSLASNGSAVEAVSVLLVAALVYTLGDLLSGNASSALSYALSNPALMGQYQGVSTLGFGVANTAAPILLTAALLGGSRYGWWLIGLMFGVTSSLVPVLAARATKAIQPAS